MNAANLEGVISEMRAAGMRVTAQREAILGILVHEYPRQLDAAEIFERARERVPRMNLASVYRTVKALKTIGVVDETAVDDGGRRYGLKRTDDQYNLRCSRCDQVIAVSSPLLQQIHALRQELAQQLPFVIDDVEISLIGHCNGSEAACEWSDRED